MILMASFLGTFLVIHFLTYLTIKILVDSKVTHIKLYRFYIGLRPDFKDVKVSINKK